MISEVSIIPNEGAPTEESIYTRYVNAIKQPAKEFLNTLYVCEREIVYNNPNVDITEAWLINNNAYIYKIEDDDIVKFTLNEESCEGNTAEVGAVVSQQFTARLVYSDAYKTNCTTPSEGYDNYFDDKCLIAFNRLALKYSDELYIPVEELPTQNISTDVIYLIATNTVNVWEQWQYDGEEWEKLSEDFEYDIFEPYPIQWGSVPLGVYYVYDEPKIGSLFVDITCYDKTIELSRKMTFIGLNYYQVMQKMFYLFKIVPTQRCISAITAANSDLIDEQYNEVKIPTTYTYRQLLKYAAIYRNGIGFVHFNRNGKLEQTRTSSTIPNIYGDDIKTSKVGTARNYKIAGLNNGVTINNGYAVKVPDLELYNETTITSYLETYAEIAREINSCTITTLGFPHLEIGDTIRVVLQDAVFNEDTCEYEYVDKEPFFSYMHKQQFTFSSGVSQNIECFDVDTENVLIASTKKTLDIPTTLGFLNAVFDKNSLDFRNIAPGTVTVPIKTDYKPHSMPSGQEYIPRLHNVFATPKTNKPSKVFPPTIDLGYFQQDGLEHIACYSTVSSIIPISWFGLKFFNLSNVTEQINENAYITQDFLFADTYEEYHNPSSGYILFGNFIIEWGIASCDYVSSAADNEYYGNVTFVKEFAEEPTVILTPLTGSAYYVTSCSFENITTTGMRVYNCNKVFSQGVGKGVQWIAIGRSKDE